MPIFSYFLPVDLVDERDERDDEGAVDLDEPLEGEVERSPPPPWCRFLSYLSSSSLLLLYDEEDPP